MIQTNNSRDTFDAEEEDRLRSVLGEALLRFDLQIGSIQLYNIHLCAALTYT